MPKISRFFLRDFTAAGHCRYDGVNRCVRYVFCRLAGADITAYILAICVMGFICGALCRSRFLGVYGVKTYSE